MFVLLLLFYLVLKLQCSAYLLSMIVVEFWAVKSEVLLNGVDSIRDNSVLIIHDSEVVILQRLP